ncbi:MAG: CrcB family protein [Porticoccaceae bacterium]
MTPWLLVALGGAFGAVGRFAVNGLLFPLFGPRFPFATLVINAAGSLLMGVCYVLIIERGVLAGEWRDLLMVGVLGAFTTFSAFSLDAVALWQNGHLLLALGYVLASVILSIGGLALAIYFTRLL